MKNSYQICKYCIMDTSDPKILFDKNGICNHCKFALNRKDSKRKYSKDEITVQFSKLIEKIKLSRNKNTEYDCIIGLSGGADSSFAAYKIKEAGLNPLAIHIDNGWNTEFAVSNIENIVKKLDIDYIAYVIDWDEFRDLQVAFLKSSVVDLEMLTDNAISVIISRLAKKHKIKYFLSGTNLSTESIMPSSWFYDIKYDSRNIKSINLRHGIRKKFESFPLFSLKEYLSFKYFRKLNSISILDYLNYNKMEAIEILKKEFDWKDHLEKHFESRITRFYQGYILPKKFNIDKRRAFFSALICAEQITREEALESIKINNYSPTLIEEDKAYFCKKMQISITEFDKIMNEKPVDHFSYPSYAIWDIKIRNLLRPVKHLLIK